MGIVACFIGLWMNASLKSQSAPRSDYGTAIHWIAVDGDATSRDTNILNTIIRDALTNQVLASIREFYGGVSNRMVRYTGFPAGYRPNLAGYLFEPLPSSNFGSGLKLTLALSGMWIDQPTPERAKDDFRVLRPPYPAERGALLSFGNSGGPVTNGNFLTSTMGGCMFGYEIRSISNGWSVGLLGKWDP